LCSMVLSIACCFSIQSLFLIFSLRYPTFDDVITLRTLRRVLGINLEVVAHRSDLLRQNLCSMVLSIACCFSSQSLFFMFSLRYTTFDDVITLRTLRRVLRIALIY